MITAEKLRIYNTYRGDSDGMARMGREWEYDLFEKGEWAAIEKMYQDVLLINKRHVAMAYTDQAIKAIWEQCDYATAKEFVNRLRFYDAFQMITRILNNIRLLVRDDADTTWAGYDDAKEFKAELGYHMERLRFFDFEVLEKVAAHFIVSGPYQEMAIAGGWSKEYLELAEQFDALYKHITQ